MPFTMTMPKLSPTMEEGMIVKWHKKEGEQIAAGDLLLEIATDKATVEHNALDEGWLRKIIIPEGGQAIVNQSIAIFTESAEESIEGYQPTGASVEAPTAVPVSDKSSEPTAKAIAPSAAATEKSLALPPSPAPTQPKATASPAPTTAAPPRIMASPLAKKLAQTQNLDLSTVKGTGPGGRVVKRDLAQAKPLAGSVTRTARPQIPAGSFTEILLTPMRKVIAKRLQEAKATIPHFYVQQNINAEALIAVREQLKLFGHHVTFNDLTIKACALALSQHPNVNSGFDPVKNCLLRFQTVDIAVAVGTEGGLVTPIVTYANSKTILEISAEVKSLAIKAKEGKLQPHEYQGGSFTISNMGMFGVHSFKAILNPPQAAILAVSAIQDAAVIKNGCVVPGKIMTITLSVDHRAIDGVAAAQFIRTVQKYLENPAPLLL